jgi:hypothetical protein
MDFFFFFFFFSTSTDLDLWRHSDTFNSSNFAVRFSTILKIYVDFSSLNSINLLVFVLQGR